MKMSKLELFLSLLGAVFMFLVPLSEPLGFAEPLEFCILALALACLIPLILLRRRRRNARLQAGLPAAGTQATKGRFWLLLIILIAGTLSGPLWLPYTGAGVVLPPGALLLTSAMSCLLAVTIFLLSWRYWNKKP